MKPSRLPVHGLGILLVSLAAHAALPPLALGDRTVLADDFTDNHNAWTNVAVVNAGGAPATGKARIAASDWSSSVHDGTAVSSVLAFKTPLDLAQGPVSLYMTVRVDVPDGTDNNRFSIGLQEAAGTPACFVRLQIRPAAAGSIEYRNPEGLGQFTAITHTQQFLTTATAYYSFRLTVTGAEKGKGPATAEAFYYDARAAKYVSLGLAQSAVSLATGLFGTLVLNSRNGANGGAAYFDAVAVTQGRAPKR